MSDAEPSSNDLDQTETISVRGRDSFERLAEEFAEQCRRGESHSIADYEKRYPEHAEKIRKLLPTVALMEQLKRVAMRDRGEESRTDSLPERLGEFRVLRELGRGGMGVVYEAVQESLGRHVALKVVHNVHLNAKRLQRFQREAQAVAQLHHTNIVAIFGVGDHDGLPYYVMQYIKGTGLDSLVASWRQDGSQQDEQRWRFVARVGVQAAEALDYAHSQGVLHRDIKPANLLIDEHQTVWITDFGLAKLTGHDDLTASDDVVGTLRYLAPEALRGETDHRSDVYSLGLTLYELLTLNAPFGELSPSELLRHVNEEKPVQPRKLAPAIPRDLETIVLKAIAREPAQRYATAGALADDLNRFLEDRPILARRASPFEQLWRWSRRNRLAAAMTITAVAALLLATAIGWAGYAITAQALQRADANVSLSLEVFDDLFDRLATHDPISTPPLGETGRQAPPERGPEGASAGPHLPGPPGHGAFARELLPMRDRPGGPGPPPPLLPPGPDQFAQDHPPMGAPPGSPRQGNRAGDTALLESVLTFYDRFARQNATNPRLEGEAAWAYRKVGALYERLGRNAEAERAYTRAIAMFEALALRYPNTLEYRAKLVQTFDMAEPGSADASSLERLEKWLRRARVLIDQLVLEAPESVEYSTYRTRVYVKLGATLQRLGRLDEAETCYREAIAFQGKHIDQWPSNDGLRIDQATSREALALIALDRGRRDEARTLLDAAVDDLHVLMTGDRSPPPFHARLRSLAEAFQRLGETERAEEIGRWADEAEALPHPPPPGVPGRRPPGPPRKTDSVDD
jgi:tetratricopeptide (TPR) repeat protein/predicted Ser/Thr protein kinase